MADEERFTAPEAGWFQYGLPGQIARRLPPGTVHQLTFDTEDVEPPTEIVTEFGQLMSGGGVHVRNPDPEIERIFPLDAYIKAGKQHGGHVLRRRIVVIEDWEEV